jgi:hypothetical protein
MITIKNLEKRVIVLKAWGCSDLRLSPGLNNVNLKNVKDLKPYISSKAARGLIEGYVRMEPQTGKGLSRLKAVKVPPSLEILGIEKLESDEWKEAEAAREKNDLLNKTALIIRQSESKIWEGDEKTQNQQKQIDELLKKIEFLTNKYEESDLASKK